MHGDVMPGIVNAADWLTPVTYYYYAISLTPHINEAEPYFLPFVMLDMMVLTIY